MYAKISKHLQLSQNEAPKCLSLDGAIWWGAARDMTGKETLAPQEALSVGDKRLGFHAEGNREIPTGLL